MSTIDPIAALAAQSQAALSAAQTKKTASNLGIEDFLMLMTAQLKNQDPMKPLEGTEFVAQLAQFGTVSGIQQMQTSIETLSSSLRSSQVLNGATLVGHEVVASADSFEFTAGLPLTGEVDAPAGASGLQVRITDETGQVVRELNVMPRNGATSFTWDGLRNDGTVATSGSYDIEAIASVGGGSEALDVLMASRVTSVTIDSTGNGLTLNTAGLGQVSLADVRRVM